MLDLGTFRRGNFTFWIFVLVLVMLGAVILACLIPIYPQKEKSSRENSIADNFVII